MTKWILAAGLVAFATAAQAQYYGGSSYDNSNSYGGYSNYNNGYATSQTYGGNNDPSPNSHSAPTYTPTYRNTYQSRTYYAPSYSGGYRSGY